MKSIGAHIPQERLEALAAGLEEPNRYELVHLACCSLCREELASLEAGLAKLGKLAGDFVPPPERPVRIVFEAPPERHPSFRRMGWIAAACVLFISLWVWDKGGNQPGPVSGGSSSEPVVAAKAPPLMAPVLYTGKTEAKDDNLAAFDIVHSVSRV